MADLTTDLRPRFRVNKRNKPLPAGFMLGRIEAGAAGGDASLWGNTGHLGDNQSRAALGAFGVMDKVPIARHAIDSFILRHRADDDAVFQQHLS